MPTTLLLPPQIFFRPSYGTMACGVRACDRPRADFVGAGGGFSSLVVRSFQLFHPLVGKQLSSAICQSANRGQIRGLLSWCCCSVVAVQADQNSMSTKTQCCVTISQELIFFLTTLQLDFSNWYSDRNHWKKLQWKFVNNSAANSFFGKTKWQMEFFYFEFTKNFDRNSGQHCSWLWTNKSWFWASPAHVLVIPWNLKIDWVFNVRENYYTA